MTVALLIERRGVNGGVDRCDRLVPIATASVFTEYWQPAAAQLRLRWVPLLQTGIPIERADVAPILEELSQLRAYFASTEAAAGDSITSLLVLRIDRLAEELASIGEDVEALFIG